jgi:hypothetical protein
MAQTIVEQLQSLDEAYRAAEGENRAEIEAQLMALHQQTFSDPEAYAYFTALAPSIAGGMYIPYLFWIGLNYFLDDTENDDLRQLLFALLQQFTESDFEENDQRNLKPLLIVYLAAEKEFERDRIKAHIFDKAHPQVRDYYMKALYFATEKPTTRDTFREKYLLLRSYFPDFAQLHLPVTQLREALGAA